MTPWPAFDFSGTVALVAGASRGIGAATARAWAAAGASVVLGARDAKTLDAVAAEIDAAGGQALAVPTDVTDDTASAALVAAAVAEFGRLDFAFNNATAGSRPAPLIETDPADFDRGIAANIRGTFLGLRHQIPAILDTVERTGSGGGAIVNMASVAGLQGVANLGPYVTGKAGIIALTKSAALEYATRGVRVNVVAPGPILTHHLERAGEEAQRQAARAVPMQRTGTVEEVAATVLWLCSPAAGFITGATIPIDGGQSVGNVAPAHYEPGKRVSSRDG